MPTTPVIYCPNCGAKGHCEYQPYDERYAIGSYWSVTFRACQLTCTLRLNTLSVTRIMNYNLNAYNGSAYNYNVYTGVKLD